MNALTHPGGNLTGFINLEAGWGMQMLRMACPRRQKFFLRQRSSLMRWSDDGAIVLAARPIASFSGRRRLRGIADIPGPAACSAQSLMGRSRPGRTNGRSRHVALLQSLPKRDGGPRSARSGLRLAHRRFDTLDLKEAKALLDELVL